MNTINSRIIYLWQQFTAHKATRAELDELMEALSTGEYDDESRQYLQQLLETTDIVIQDTARWQPVLQSILHPGTVSALPGLSNGQPSRVRRLVRRTMSAAAILIVIVGLVHFWHQSRSDAPQKPVVAIQIQPGRNRAILTLSGGKQIMLDSAATGDLAVEGSALVRKSGDGQLAYHVNGSAATQVYNTLSTPRGGQYQLTLPDGTRVWLNAASSITYPTTFTGRDRSVEMTGEAYFEVIHSKGRPFKVKAGGRIIEDIGTRFNVNTYTDEPAPITTLLEGAIRIDGHVLRPGQQATGAPTGAIEITKGDPEQAVAWKNGLFEFSDADIQAVMRQLARWYNVEVTYEGAVPQRRFTGSIGRSLTLGQVLTGLAKERVHYHIEEGNKLIISP